MKSELFDLDMSDRRFADLTEDVSRFVAGEGDGLVNVLAPHATAAVVLMETGSGSEEDLHDALDRSLPREDIYRHSHGSKGHGADHLIPAWLSAEVTVPVLDGKLALGTWQSIVFVDLNRDNPRRQFRVTFLASR